MKWEFTPEQVTSGEIEYTLKQFREDLHREVADNFPEYDEKDLETMFHLAYDVCYITAAKRDFKELLLHCTLRGIKVTKEFLELLRDANKDNIIMLRAIFANKVGVIMDGGIESEEALKKLDEYHQQVLKEE